MSMQILPPQETLSTGLAKQLGQGVSQGLGEGIKRGMLSGAMQSALSQSPQEAVQSLITAGASPQEALSMLPMLQQFAAQRVASQGGILQAPAQGKEGAPISERAASYPSQQQLAMQGADQVSQPSNFQGRPLSLEETEHAATGREISMSNIPYLRQLAARRSKELGITPVQAQEMIEKEAQTLDAAVGKLRDETMASLDSVFDKMPPALSGLSGEAKDRLLDKYSNKISRGELTGTAAKSALIRDAKKISKEMRKFSLNPFKKGWQKDIGAVAEEMRKIGNGREFADVLVAQSGLSGVGTMSKTTAAGLAMPLSKTNEELNRMIGRHRGEFNEEFVEKIVENVKPGDNILAIVDRIEDIAGKGKPVMETLLEMKDANRLPNLTNEQLSDIQSLQRTGPFRTLAEIFFYGKTPKGYRAPFNLKELQKR